MWFASSSRRSIISPQHGLAADPRACLTKLVAQQAHRLAIVRSMNHAAAAHLAGSGPQSWDGYQQKALDGLVSRNGHALQRPRNRGIAEWTITATPVRCRCTAYLRNPILFVAIRLGSLDHALHTKSGAREAECSRSDRAEFQNWYPATKTVVTSLAVRVLSSLSYPPRVLSSPILPVSYPPYPPLRSIQHISPGRSQWRAIGVKAWRS